MSNIKELLELAKKSLTVEDQKKIVKLEYEIMALERKSLELEKENLELKNRLNEKTQLKNNDIGYYAEDDPERIFCRVCFEQDKKRMTLTEIKNPNHSFSYYCYNCKNYFGEKPTLPKPKQRKDKPRYYFLNKH